MVVAGTRHSVLLRSDGRVLACGANHEGQCTIPALDDGQTYTQAAAGSEHTILLRSDGLVAAFGDNEFGQCDIPHLKEGIEYTQVSAGEFHNVLLRNDGSAVACGENRYGQCNISPLKKGISYTQASAGGSHCVCLLSDGKAVACGLNRQRQCDIPPLGEGISYTQVSAGAEHTLLLRSDGKAVACGSGSHRLPLDGGIRYTQVSGGRGHSVLLRSERWRAMQHSTFGCWSDIFPSVCRCVCVRKGTTKNRIVYWILIGNMMIHKCVWGILPVSSAPKQVVIIRCFSEATAPLWHVDGIIMDSATSHHLSPVCTTCPLWILVSWFCSWRSPWQVMMWLWSVQIWQAKRCYGWTQQAPISAGKATSALRGRWRSTSSVFESFCRMASCLPISAVQIQGPPWPPSQSLVVANVSVSRSKKGAVPWWAVPVPVICCFISFSMFHHGYHGSWEVYQVCSWDFSQKQ